MNNSRRINTILVGALLALGAGALLAGAGHDFMTCMTSRPAGVLARSLPMNPFWTSH